MSKVGKFTKHGVKFLTNGSNVGPLVTYDTLKRSYSCTRCGGRIEEVFNGAVHYAVCGRCGNMEEFTSHAQERREEVEAAEVMHGLPVELQLKYRNQPRFSEKDLKEIEGLLFAGGSHA